MHALNTEKVAMEAPFRRLPRVHCPYCGDNFQLSPGMIQHGGNVKCQNVKCGSRIGLCIDISWSSRVRHEEEKAIVAQPSL